MKNDSRFSLELCISFGRDGEIRSNVSSCKISLLTMSNSDIGPILLIRKFVVTTVGDPTKLKKNKRDVFRPSGIILKIRNIDTYFKH